MARVVKILKRHGSPLEIWLFAAYRGQFSADESGIRAEKSTPDSCDSVIATGDKPITRVKFSQLFIPL